VEKLLEELNKPGESVQRVPVVTATIPVDRRCQYNEGSFPFFRGLSDSVIVMNGINAPKAVECFGSDGGKYKQLAKSGNDDLRQDAENFGICAGCHLHIKVCMAILSNKWLAQMTQTMEQ
ncbi:hypothetical protein AALP_AAs40004U000100, partial [Arabis alpina]